jgi:hypothetical protein
MVLHTGPFLPISVDLERTVLLLEARVGGPVDPQFHQEDSKLIDTHRPTIACTKKTIVLYNGYE